MNVAIIGGGAIGLLAAYYLKKQGHTVTVVTRTERQKEALIREGLTLERNQQFYRCNVLVASFSEGDYVKADLWIVALKQTQLKVLFERWGYDKQVPPILFLQNGLGHLEWAMEWFTSPINAGVVTHGAMKVNDHHVRHTGSGKIFIAPWGSAYLGKLTELIMGSSGDFPLIDAENIEYILKRKLLINLIVNPLTALYGIKNGKLLTRPEWEVNMRALFHEGREVLGVAEDEWEMVVEVIRNTAENESSMLRDLKQGRQTEIQAITGYILKLAEKKKVAVPVTSFIHCSIVGLEGGK